MPIYFTVATLMIEGKVRVAKTAAMYIAWHDLEYGIFNIFGSII